MMVILLDQLTNPKITLFYCKSICREQTFLEILKKMNLQITNTYWRR